MKKEPFKFPPDLGLITEQVRERIQLRFPDLDVHDVEDVAATAALAVLAQPGSGTELASPLGFAQEIAVRAAVGLLRSRSKHNYASDPTANIATVDEHQDLCINETLRALSPSDRLVVSLRVLEQLSTCEVAKIIGMHESTVRSRLKNALLRLRELQQEPESHSSIAQPSVSQHKKEERPSPHSTSQSLSLVVDEDINADLFAEFMTELSKFYAELSGGDELVIREGKIPVRSKVLV